MPTGAAASAGYVPTGRLASPLDGSFPIGAGFLVIKAGTGTTNGGGDLTVTFATAFPNAMVAATMSLSATPSNASTNLSYASASASGFTISSFGDNGSARASVAVAWIAVGY